MDVIEFEFFKGRQNVIVVKEFSVAAQNAPESFGFKSLNTMVTHGSEENGNNLEVGHVAYHELYTVVSEAVARLSYLYGYGFAKCKFYPN